MKLYVEGEEEAVIKMLEFAKGFLGEGINVIDVNPVLVDSEVGEE